MHKGSVCFQGGSLERVDVLVAMITTIESTHKPRPTVDDLLLWYVITMHDHTRQERQGPGFVACKKSRAQRLPALLGHDAQPAPLSLTLTQSQRDEQSGTRTTRTMPCNRRPQHSTPLRSSALHILQATHFASILPNTPLVRVYHYP
jgi:hypothetical protein